MSNSIQSLVEETREEWLKESSVEVMKPSGQKMFSLGLHEDWGDSDMIADWWISKLTDLLSKENLKTIDVLKEFKNKELRKARMLDYADRTECDYACDILDRAIKAIQSNK